jgi:Fur family zinc uptake transcriptional regulator
VYRALEFLTEHKLIHRIHSLNAFVGCPEPGTRHQNHFLICRQCGQAEECGSRILTEVIDKAAAAADFEAQDQVLEVIGLCAVCRQPDQTMDASL